MSGYQLGLLFHLIGVILFFSGAAVAGVIAMAANRRRSPSEIAVILGLGRPGAVLLGIGGVILLIAGFYLAGQVDGFGMRWLDASILLFVLSLLAGAWGGRRSRGTRAYAVALAERGEGDEATLHAKLENRPTWILHWASVVLAVAVLVLMVWQPGS